MAKKPAKTQSFSLPKKTRAREMTAAVHHVELEPVGRGLFLARIDGVSLARSRDPLRTVAKRLRAAGLAHRDDAIVAILAGEEILRSTIGHESCRPAHPLLLRAAGTGSA